MAIVSVAMAYSTLRPAPSLHPGSRTCALVRVRVRVGVRVRVRVRARVSSTSSCRPVWSESALPMSLCTYLVRVRVMVRVRIRARVRIRVRVRGRVRVRVRGQQPHEQREGPHQFRHVVARAG